MHMGVRQYVTITTSACWIRHDPPVDEGDDARIVAAKIATAGIPRLPTCCPRREMASPKMGLGNATYMPAVMMADPWVDRSCCLPDSENRSPGP